MSGDWLDPVFPWLKAAHVIAVIFWMAGLLMLPRFYAYHAEDLDNSTVGSALDRTWCVREQRVLRFIINPAMMVSWILGLFLAFHISAWGALWFHVKFLTVLLLSVYHGLLARWRKDFANGTNRHSGKFFRQINEIPAVMTIVIVLMVILKP